MLQILSYGMRFDGVFQSTHVGASIRDIKSESAKYCRCIKCYKAESPNSIPIITVSGPVKNGTDVVFGTHKCYNRSVKKEIKDNFLSALISYVTSRHQCNVWIITYQKKEVGFANNKARTGVDETFVLAHTIFSNC